MVVYFFSHMQTYVLKLSFLILPLFFFECSLSCFGDRSHSLKQSLSTFMYRICKLFFYIDLLLPNDVTHTHTQTQKLLNFSHSVVALVFYSFMYTTINTVHQNNTGSGYQFCGCGLWMRLQFIFLLLFSLLSFTLLLAALHLDRQ